MQQWFLTWLQLLLSVFHENSREPQRFRKWNFVELKVSLNSSATTLKHLFEREKVGQTCFWRTRFTEEGTLRNLFRAFVALRCICQWLPTSVTSFWHSHSTQAENRTQTNLTPQTQNADTANDAAQGSSPTNAHITYRIWMKGKTNLFQRVFQCELGNYRPKPKVTHQRSRVVMTIGRDVYFLKEQTTAVLEWVSIWAANAPSGLKYFYVQLASAKVPTPTSVLI